MAKKSLVGKEVRVTFLDHCMHSDPHMGPMEFYAYGKVVVDAPTYLNVASWISTNPEDMDNVEIFTILKATIIRIDPI